MEKKILLVVPEAPVQQAASASTQRTISAKGLRLGTLDNSKSNADHLLEMIIDGVKEKFPDAQIVRTRKPSAAIGAAADVLAELEKETDVVIAAMAD